VDVSKVTSKTLRRTMATVLSKKVSMAELVEIGGWSGEAMARRYIETLNVFAAGTRNYADQVFAVPAGTSSAGGEAGSTPSAA
jgi:hypothetical protein